MVGLLRRGGQEAKAPRSRGRRRRGGKWEASPARLPFPSRLGGPAERHELPQRGPGQKSPAENSEGKLLKIIYKSRKKNHLFLTVSAYALYAPCLVRGRARHFKRII